MTKINFHKVIIIVVSSFCLGMTYNYFSQAGVPLFGFSIKQYITNELLRSDNGNLQPENEPKHISLKEAVRLHEANVIFIDARDSGDFRTGHIKNAINIPYNEMEKYMEVLSSIPKNEPLVSYCGGSDCELSIMLGNKLAKMGYKNVFIFFGGWNAWTEAKYPISNR